MVNKSRSRIILVLLVMLALVFVPLAGKAIAAQLELNDQSAAPGSTVVFTLSAISTPNDVASLGVDIGFDATVLEYVSADFSGTLLEPFAFKDVSNPSAGLLKLGGFSLTAIPAGSTGLLVRLTFNVIGDQDCQLTLTNLVDDIAGWTTRDGTFEIEALEINPDSALLQVGTTQVFQAVGGTAPYTWSIVDDDGTKGSLSAATGTQVTYTAPAVAPGADVTVQVQDSGGLSATATVTVYDALAINPSTSQVKVSMTQLFQAVGGQGPFTWSIVGDDGSMGSLSTDTGVQVTYTAPDQAPAAAVTIQVEDNQGQTATATVTVYEELTVDPDTATVKVGETQDFQALGGLAPFSWSIVDDDGTKGSISPTSGDQVTYTAPAQAPAAAVTVQVQDAAGQTATATVTVYEGLGISPASANVKVGLTQDFQAEGGQAPYTWSIVGDDGSMGSLSSDTGVQVTYTAPADVPAGLVTIQLEDNQGQTATATVTVYDVLAVDPPTATVKVNETQIFQRVDGLAPFSWSIVNDDGTKGSLSPTSGDQVTYTAPAQAPAAAVTIQVQDAAGQSAQATVTVFEGLTIAPPSSKLKIGEDQDLQAVGGQAPYSWSILEGGGSIDPTTGETVTYTAPAQADTGGVTVTIQVQDDIGDTATATVQIYEDLVITPQTADMEVGTTLDFQASGGLAPFTWAITAGGGSLDPTAGTTVTYTAPGEAGQATVEVADDAGQSTQATVEIWATVAIPEIPADFDPNNPDTFPVVESGDSLDLSVTGGLGVDYDWEVLHRGQVTQTATGAEFTFEPLTDGAFAGSYIITATNQVTGTSSSFIVKTPMEWTPHTKNVAGGEVFDLVLAGADPAAQISDGEYLDQDNNVVPEDEEDHYAIPPTLPIDFELDSTATAPFTGADVAALMQFKVRATVSGDQDLTDNSLDVATTGWVRVLPVATFSGVVQDADTGDPIPGAIVGFKLGGQEAEATTLADGTFAVALLSPEMMGGEYGVLVSDDGYLSAAFTTAGWVNPQAIELSLAAASVTGTVTESGTGAPLGDALVETTVDGETIVAYTVAGSYRLELPVAGLTELEARASKAMYVALRQDVLLDSDFELEPQSDPGGMQQVCEDGGVFADAACTVDVPPDAFEAPGCYDLEVNPDIEVGEDSPYTGHSAVLVEINLPGATLAEPLKLTIPFDPAEVTPGAYSRGEVVVYHAPTADDLRNGVGVTAVPPEDIVYEDHVVGEVCFLVRTLSAFGSGGALGGGGGGAGGGGGGGCFIATAALDSPLQGKAAILLALLSVTLVTLGGVFRRKDKTIVR